MRLRLAFSFDSRHRVSAIDGRLVVELRRYDGRPTAVRPAELKLRGVSELPTDITFDPSSITLGISRAPWPLDRVHQKPASVTLRGDGARILLDAVGRSGTAAYSVLRNDAGDSVEVRLSNLRRADGVVLGDVSASHIEHVGLFTGDLPLSPGGGDAPKLSITVKVGSAFAWAVLAVLLGAIVGAVIPIQRAIGRRRRVLRVELDDAVEAYEAELARNDGVVASYDLESVPEIGHRPWDKGPCRGGGIRQLVCEIQDARADEEFDKADASLTEKTGHIDRWLRVERPVGELRRRFGDMPDALDGWSFEDSRIYGLTFELLDRVREEPDTDDKARHLLHEIRGQTVTFFMFCSTWALRRNLAGRRETMSAEQQKLLDGVDLKFIDDDAPEPGDPDATKYRMLRGKLHGALLKLERLDKELPDRAQSAATPSGELPDPSEPPKFDERVDEVAQEVDEEIGFGAEPKESGTLKWKRRTAFFNNYDIFWTLLPVAGASTAYALTIYKGGTWGSLTDFATAFTAGFGSKLATDSALKLNWSELPLFTSKRASILPKAKAPEGQTTPNGNRTAAPAGSAPIPPADDSAAVPSPATGNGGSGGTAAAALNTANEGDREVEASPPASTSR